MAFPTIPTTGNGRLLSQNQNNTTAARTFPSLSSLTKNAGDMLVAIVVAYERVAASASFASWGASFTERYDIDGGATTMAVGIATKVSDGTETGTFTVTQGAAPTGHCTLFLLSIAGGGPIMIDATALAVGTGAAADPAALDPANWGTEDTLWISIAGNGETNTSGAWNGIGDASPSAPTNYTSLNSPGLGTDAVGGIQSAVAFRQNATGSENVGTWTSNDISNARNCAMLLAIRPALVKAGTGKHDNVVGGGDQVIYVERGGASISSLVGSGVSEEVEPHVPIVATKVGLAVLGERRYGGVGVIALTGSGVDAVTWADTGSGILARVASGVAVKVGGAVEKTGAGIVSDLKGAASDAVTWTETGSGVLVRSTSASDAVTFTETGSATLPRVASATDEATFVETGTGILARTASGVRESVGNTYTKTGLGRMGAEITGATSTKAGAGVAGLSASGGDATTFTETGSGVLNAVGSGVAVRQGSSEKTGAGIRGHVGAGSDAASFVETGAGIRVLVGSGADASTFAETGGGVLVRSGSATDAVTFVEAGTGILARTAGGARESGGGTTYTKAAIGVMGRRLGGGAAGTGIRGLTAGGTSQKISGGKFGTGIRGLAASASDAATWQRTSKLARYDFSEPPSLDDDYPPSFTAVGSGVAVKVGAALEKTGTGTRGFVGAAADAVTFTESGAGVLARSASATDAVSFIETGAGKLGASGSGAAVRVSEGAKTGVGIRGFVGSAADAATFVETGAGVLNRTGGGSDAVTFTETGKGVLSASGGGTGRRGLEAEKTGTATRVHTARGADAVTFTKSVAGILNRAATGSDTAQFTKRGTGVLDRYASGDKFKLGEFVKFGSATAVFVASGAVETDLDRPPPGIITSTNTGRITRVRVGRITHSREGVLV